MTAGKRAGYVLVRTLPDGTERSAGSPLPTVRAAAVAASYVLYDNARVPKAEAQRFAAQLAALPLGETAVHDGSGYRFRIEIHEGE
jgi:hypothetical protein